MRSLKILFLFFLFTNLFISAQANPDFPQLAGTDIPGGKITRTSYYDGDALWGLIDGGADVYLEYGFNKLLFQEIEWMKLKFRVEIYRMNEIKSAFGIFSASRYKCDLNDTLTKFICITPYQVQAAVGRFYFSIANEKGDKEAQRFTVAIFSKYLTTLKEELFDLPDLFQKPVFESHKNKMKYIKGRLGMQNSFPAWIEMFDPYSDYEIYLLPIELEKGYAYLAQIKFVSDKETLLFINKNEEHKQKNLSKIIKSLSTQEIILLESNLPDDELKEILVLVNNK